MSVAFPSARPRTKGEVTPQSIQKMLDENHHLIQCIMDYQSKGKTAECTQYQQILHRNLVYLATIADSNQNMQSLLPAPPTHNMGMGPSSGHTSGNDNMTSGLTPTTIMQTNVPMMHQAGAPHYSSAQMGAQLYQGQGAMGQSQSNNMMSQRPLGSYRSSQPGSTQRHMGEDHGEQYGHTQSGAINPQYYPDGHGEYSYQQTSYGEQYERSFDESSQHYYEGNSQYSQTQGQYQQGSGQQAFGQQQYSSQPGYGAPPQGYGPGQGSSSQYPHYQQGQGQYGSYRSSQGGGQAQRPYSYEQGQYGNYQQ
ncbi:calcium-responsive transactivator-like isoform X1 [Periophthalmus magnuspinnatus]|uniref:calcium-responsive transactivator-like isoform X1 n=1 Tax=Periophthalmus magnuspinnatus TaxID=409849 RepID=UPI00243699A2|nr:calcium-responsive transactivator-like isoform X1 [Periophthalmus magnuspinnatus]